MGSEFTLVRVYLSDSDNALPAAEFGADDSAKLRCLLKTWSVRSSHQSAAISHHPAWDAQPLCTQWVTAAGNPYAFPWSGARQSCGH